MNSKYIFNTVENKEMLKQIRENLIEFGRRFPAPDGSSYYLGDDGTPLVERNRETWITSRMAHVYSIGHILGYANCGELADCAIKGLKGALRDKEHGGWYAGIIASGDILPTKQCYAHAFVILASCSALAAKREGAEELLEDALATYNQYFWDEENGLAYDTYNTEFTELNSYRGINANMHTVEAFLAVADMTGDDVYRERAGRIIDHVVEWAKSNNYRIPEHFTDKWEMNLDCNKERPDDPFKPYGATPGHGIEWARLITQWASSCKVDQELDKYIEVAQHLYNRAIEDAWNVNGARGIVYTTDWDGKPVVRDRMHWTLAEAINTSAVLYRVTGKEKYAQDYQDFMQYLDEVVLDHENGSWFHQLDENNQLKTTVWPGKSDLYHALQATLIPYGNVSISVVKSLNN